MADKLKLIDLTQVPGTSPAPAADAPAGQVAPGRRVRLHFALRLPDGEEIDSTFERAPVTLVIGDGNMLPGFEQVLMGLDAGSRQQFRVPPEHAFGRRNPDNVHRFPRAGFDAELPLEPGLVLGFAGTGGEEQPGVVVSADEREVVIDFNHPLADREIEFEVEILQVEEA